MLVYLSVFPSLTKAEWKNGIIVCFASVCLGNVFKKSLCLVPLFVPLRPSSWGSIVFRELLLRISFLCVDIKFILDIKFFVMTDEQYCAGLAHFLMSAVC